MRLAIRSNMKNPFTERLPKFAQAIDVCEDSYLENVLPGASDDEIRALEAHLGLELPLTYKDLLRCARGFWLFGGAIQFGSEHPFFHDFPPLAALNPAQINTVRIKGGGWPPPSQGMLCFAEFFLEADGDQVLWDVRSSFGIGEYPIYYYAHEDRPPSVRKVAESFDAFLETALTLFNNEE